MDNQQSPQTPINIPDFQPKPNYLKTIIFSILGITLLATTIYLYFQNQKLQKQVLNPPFSPTIQVPSPVSQSVSLTPKTSITIPLDETAGWKIYSNATYGYSIRHPNTFTTQLIATGAGNKEADSSTRSLFIYQSDAKEPYLERYVNLEAFGIKPTYNQGTITEVNLNNLTAIKIIIPESKFDIYSVQLNNKEFLEIYISNDLAKKDLANKILSTFQFTN